MKTLNRLAASIGIKMQIATMEGQIQRLFNSEPLVDSHRELTLFHRLARLGNQVDHLSEHTSLRQLDSELIEAVAQCQQDLDRLEQTWTGSKVTLKHQSKSMHRNAELLPAGARSSEEVERPPPNIL